nr:HAD hydrolase family protein [Peptoniphilus sp. oral taxon 836]
MVFTGKNEDLFKLRDVFNSNISDKFNIHLMAMQTRAEYMLEVLQKNGDKFEGLKFYCKSKNIDLKDVVAIGDDSNDKNIIKNCGLGIAMINAIPDVKDVAKLISKKDNNNNGAIEILKEVLW